MVKTFEPVEIGVDNNAFSHPQTESTAALMAEAQAPLPFQPIFWRGLTTNKNTESQ